MRKFIAAAVASAALVGVLAGTVGASGDGGTIIRTGFECAVLDGNGQSFITTNSSLTVFGTKSVMRCTGDGAPYTGPNPPHYFTFAETGLTCSMAEFGSTENWTDKVGRLGNSQLVCIGPPTPVTAPSGGGAGVGG
jgi:hypothetical protein